MVSADNDRGASPAQQQHVYDAEPRHGFQVISQEWMSQLAENYYDYFNDKRHETQGKPQDIDDKGAVDWRVVDRRRTVNAALVMCLNLGVDPPDIIKTQPAARVEAWTDPAQYVDSRKALEQIGKSLQGQYESLSARVKYKQSLDPNIDDIKRFCVSLRRSARDDRILFHYNGHGVPRPTPSGEIWVFNRGYTQYIPLSISDLQTWLGAPVIYCYDCSGSGNIINSYNHFVKKRKQRDREEEAALKAGNASMNGSSSANRGQFGDNSTQITGSMPSLNGLGVPSPTYKPAYETCIQLSSCRADEILPMNPLLPADLFTCCITTPVDIAVKWFLIQNSRGFASAGLDPDDIRIPGKISNRRTPLGELNWIFTAISDTIAWSALTPTLFKQLFRQDLIVAAMFRNFLLASRIMRTYNCHPQSSPELPDTCDHPLWDSWDAAINHCLLQVATPPPNSDGRLFSDFFEQQLTAFELWLNYQSGDDAKPPEQLPILLQVLLSQIHRLRALSLLCRYLDLGPRAVRVALNIDFFIYVLKLLQSPAPELRPVLVFIWTCIIAVDQKVQTELIKDHGYQYFVNILVDINTQESVPMRTKSGDPAMCCFILAQFCHGFSNAQQILTTNNELLTAVEHFLEADSPLLRQWAVLLLAELVPLRSISKILWRLKDPIPEVRASVLYTLCAYVSRGRLGDNDVDMVGKAVVSMALDGSPLVRNEFVMFLSHFMCRNFSKFMVCAFTTLEEEFAASKYGGDMRSESPAHGTVSLALWRCLLVLSDDAMQYVRDSAIKLIDSVQSNLSKTSLGDEVTQMSRVLLDTSELNRHIRDDAINADLQGRKGSSSQNGAEHSEIPERRREAADSHAMLQAMSSHNQQESRSPKKSLVQLSVDWVFGSGDAFSPSTQQEETQRLRSRNSLASLVSSLSTSDPLNHKDNGAVSETSSLEADHRSANTFIPPTPPALDIHVNHLPDGKRMTMTSDFREFCVEYFREPQLKPIEADEAGSKIHFKKLWRKSRNEKIMADTQRQKTVSVTGTWNNHIATLQGLGESAKSLCFAQFEPHLLTSDSMDVGVFDWEKGRVLNRFRGGRELSSVQLINEDDSPLVLTASRDGVARVFRNYNDPNTCEIISSWWLFADLVHHQSANPTVLVDWQQSRGHLLVGGDARVVRIWDAAREQAVGDIPVRTSSQLTALTSDKVAGNYFLTGFSDGAIHLYDRRLDKQSALVRRWKPKSSNLHSTRTGHSSRILNLRMQRGGTREIVSGSIDGQVCLWDMRYSEPVKSFRAHSKSMTCMDIHEHAPVIGTASRVAGIWSVAGRRISTLKGPSSSNYLSTKVSPVGALAFHPHQMVMAMGNSEEPIVAVYKCTP